MATREQCEIELKSRLTTKSAVESFAKEWLSSKITTNQNWNDETFVAKNIEYILDQAEQRGTLDKLGRKFSIPSDAEQRRTAMSPHHSRSPSIAADTQIAPKPAKVSSMVAESSIAAKIFIIHGHDEAKRRELKDLLTNHFHLDAVVMQEKPGKSRTLIEKFEEEADQCNAAIAILTADDFVSNTDKRYGQPRPNVIYELGWFAGKYGRSRTLMIVKDGTDVPSDLGGIEQIRFSENISEKLLDLEQEIKAWSQPSKTATTASPPSDSGKENQDQRELREELDALKLAIFGETDVQKIRNYLLKLEEEIKAAGRLR